MTARLCTKLNPAFRKVDTNLAQGVPAGVPKSYLADHHAHTVTHFKFEPFTHLRENSKFSRPRFTLPLLQHSTMPPQRTPLRNTDGNRRYRGPNLSPYQRGEISGLYKAGKTPTQIEKHFPLLRRAI